jgi:sulfatase modifying factor 1
VNPTRPGRAALLLVLGAAALGGCGLLVGTPIGDYVFPSDASVDAADALSLDGDVLDSTAAADGPSTSDAPSPVDAPSTVDASADGRSVADAADGGCPGSQGPPSIVVTSDQGSYCIDSTEVTTAQYGVFLKAGFQLAADDVPALCEAEVDGGSMNFTPALGWPPEPGTQLFPVVQVTWCQAYAYCAWAGKRLCGQIGGGPLAQANAANASVSEWTNACSVGGSLVYPYGNTFDSATCGGSAAGSQVANVKTPAACVGGFPGLYNMSGNVWEWTNACNNMSYCCAMGGAFDGTATDLECTGIRPWLLTASAPDIGFRCCGDL